MHIFMVASQGRISSYTQAQTPSSSKSKEVGSSKGQQIASTMPVPDSEDSVSFERHNRALQGEYNKVRPNKQVVEELMSQSFAMHWNDLQDNRYDLEAVFEKYPQAILFNT